MTDEKRPAPLNCAEPLDAAVLADYWAAVLPVPDEERLEEHLLACDACAARLREVIALADGIGMLARSGSLRMIVNDAYLERAANDGIRIRAYDFLPGSRVACTVTPDDDLLIGRFSADVSGAQRVDLSLCDERGVEHVRMRDIPVSSRSGGVVYQESITFAKAAPSATTIAKLVSIDETGAERVLGEYTLDHTRSMPGPAAW
jgi:hypothetical protein